MTLSALIAIYFVHLAGAMSPGPAVLLAARTSLQQGMWRGSLLALGIGLGAGIWALAALLGLALVFAMAPVVLIVLKVFGCSYLAYLAYKMWRDASEPMSMDVDAAKAQHSELGLIMLGITTQLANPKAAVFFGTVFFTFLPANPPLWGYIAILAIVVFNDAGWNIIVSRIFSLERTRKGYLNLKTAIDRCFGGILALLSAKIALT